MAAALANRMRPSGSTTQIGCAGPSSTPASSSSASTSRPAMSVRGDRRGPRTVESTLAPRGLPRPRGSSARSGPGRLVAEAALHVLLGVVVAERLDAFAEAAGLLVGDRVGLTVAEAAQTAVQREVVGVGLATCEGPARQVARIVQRFAHRGPSRSRVLVEHVAGKADHGRDVEVTKAVGGSRRPALQERVGEGKLEALVGSRRAD